jgi:hypothetical protein
MSAISDIRHLHLLFRYRKKICRTETVIPITKEFWYRVLSPFRYPISKTYFSHLLDLNPRPLFSQASALPLSQCADLWTFGCWMVDIGYRIKVYSDIRYNVGLRSLQSNIESSDIMLSPISLIKDIGVSAHLWSKVISSDWYCISVRCWHFFFKKGQHLGFCKKVLSSFDSKLLVMCERTGEALKMVQSAYQFVTTWHNHLSCFHNHLSR